jgi:hypothetical protein
MVQHIADRRDLDFVIWEQMNGEAFLEYDSYKDFNRKTCDMIITEARNLAVKEVLPTLQEGDHQGVRFENGNVKTPDCFARVHQLLLEGEWGNLSVPQDMGGQGPPAWFQRLRLNTSWALTGHSSATLPWETVLPT